MKHFIDINSFKKKEIDEIISLAKKIDEAGASLLKLPNG